MAWPNDEMGRAGDAHHNNDARRSAVPATDVAHLERFRVKFVTPGVCC